MTPETSRVEKADPSNIIKFLCCDRCYYAKGVKCTCRCNGTYHGLGCKVEAVHQRRLGDVERKEFPEDL